MKISVYICFDKDQWAWRATAGCDFDVEMTAFAKFPEDAAQQAVRELVNRFAANTPSGANNVNQK